MHSEVQASISRMREKNSEWSYNLITTKEEMDSFMVENFKKPNNQFRNNVYTSYIEIPNIINHIKGRDPKVRDLVSQCDIYRIAVVYLYGGLYLDIDSELDGDFNKLLKNDALFILTPREVWNGCFYSTSEHPILRNLLERIFYRLTKVKDVNMMTLAGPGLHFEVACRLIDNTIENSWDVKADEYTDKIFEINNVENHSIIYSSVQRETDKDFLFSNSILLTISTPWSVFLYKDPNDPNSPFNQHFFL